MADRIIEIIKAEVRPGFEYKSVQVAGKHGAYNSHRWVRQDVPDPADVGQRLAEAKKYLREQMVPRRMQLREQWQGWVQLKARWHAEVARNPALARINRHEIAEAVQQEKQYGKMYRQYRLEHMEYARYVHDLEHWQKKGKPAQEQQGALFPKSGLTAKPAEPEPESTSRYQHEFDTSPDVTRSLATEEIVSRKAFGEGCNGAFKVRLADGKSAAWKMQFFEAEGLRGDIPQGEYSKREAAAYEISEALGWHLVPPTTVRADEFGDIGSIQLWNDDGELPYNQRVREDQKWKMAIFDLIIGNEDRHDHNYLITPAGDVIAIDNGLTLGESGRPSYRNKFASNFLDNVHHGDAREPIPDQYLEDVRQVNWDAVTAHVKTHVSPEAARHMKARVDYVLEKGDLFEIRYDTDFAAWRHEHGDDDRREAMKHGRTF